MTSGVPAPARLRLYKERAASCRRLGKLREKLLHQPSFVGLEHGELLGLGGDEVVEAAIVVLFVKIHE